MNLPSRDHRYPATGRLVSVVSNLAELKGSPVFFTQILRVFDQGFRNARYFPSGETSAPVISGSPKSSSRSMSGGKPCNEDSAVTRTIVTARPGSNIISLALVRRLQILRRFFLRARSIVLGADRV